LDRLRAGAPARVVVVASNAHKGARHGLDFDDLQAGHRYRWQDAYNKSKLANIYFARELGRRLDGTGVTVNALHPGFVRGDFGLRDEHNAAEGLAALDVVVGAGGVGQRERAVDHDTQVAGGDVVEVPGDRRTHAIGDDLGAEEHARERLVSHHEHGRVEGLRV